MPQHVFHTLFQGCHMVKVWTFRDENVFPEGFASVMAEGGRPHVVLNRPESRAATPPFGCRFPFSRPHSIIQQAPSGRRATSAKSMQCGSSNMHLEDASQQVEIAFKDFKYRSHTTTCGRSNTAAAQCSRQVKAEMPLQYAREELRLVCRNARYDPVLWTIQW